MNKFYVGQKVVALKNIESYLYSRLIKEGQIVEVAGFETSCCPSLNIKGYKIKYKAMSQCIKCGYKGFERVGDYIEFSFEDFAPLQETTDEMVEETLSQIGIEIAEPLEIL